MLSIPSPLQVRDKLFIKTVSGGSPELIVNLLPCALCWKKGHNVFNCSLILSVDVRLNAQSNISLF